MPELTPQLEAGLLEGFLARRWTAENELCEVLRPFLRQVIRRDFPSLWEWSADLQQSALVRLCELRDDDPDERYRIQPPISKLATYLVNAPARVLLRTKKRFGRSRLVKDEDATGPSNQEASARLKELMRLTARLPKELATTLHLQAAHVLGEGPPLHEALGIDPNSAQRRLLYAQDALLTLSRNEVDDG